MKLEIIFISKEKGPPKKLSDLNIEIQNIFGGKKKRITLKAFKKYRKKIIGYL
ncbi:MAG: hypothetical protein L7S72_05325 [Flavobacteriales bacterium]|nr:hypothetical protein [Flavobacteriales bacterium]